MVAQASNSEGWTFWIDRGGTFTDIVARSPEGSIQTHKLLSQNPERYSDAALQGIREVLGIASDAPIAHGLIKEVRMGTTVATNALLERKGEPTALFITKGFGDALRIAYQQRPQIFARHIVLPELLCQQVIEVDERVTATGEVLCNIDEPAVRRALQQVYAAGIRSVAIVLMHGYRYPRHEQQLAQLARAQGFSQISVSYDVSPLMKLVSRGDTTVVDAYLSPLLRRYVDSVAAELGHTRLLFMQSNGGLVDAHQFQGKDSILSGPAGGVVGATEVAQQAGIEKIIGFDMGGTSTDVCHFDGELERVFETQLAGVRMSVPMMHIHTVAAGGGSILHFDGTRYRVGPDSAGADPGPACYRRGGPLSVTDCNLMLGKLVPEFFPQVFGSSGDQPLDRACVEHAFGQLAHTIEQATGERHSVQQVAHGFLEVAVENMANAIRKISLQRGYDVAQYSLCCFGGAGGQHACLVADALGMQEVLIHPHAGVLSAYGMGLAQRRSVLERTVELAYVPAVTTELEHQYGLLEQQGLQAMAAQGLEARELQCLRRLHMKYAGSDSSLLLDHGTYEQVLQDFNRLHRQRYGFIDNSKGLVVAALSVEVIAGQSLQPASVATVDALTTPAAARPLTQVPLYSVSADHASTGEFSAAVYRRAQLVVGHSIDGPALIIEANSTIVLEPGWQARVDALGNLRLQRVVPLHLRHVEDTSVDPVRLEIFNNLFMSIAEQMGSILELTSHSVNMKERLDFSCAVFDADGQLVANAPHVPVHLGSMGESVQSIIQAHAAHMRPGDVYALNAPYNGGTHLPDVTVVTPVFDEAGEAILFYVASRGHHADIGGITPGSMPPQSHSVEQEGVLIDNFLLVQQGRLRERELMDLLNSGPYPVRNAQQNLADLQAQIAANEKGLQELYNMVRQYGLATVQAYMQHVQDNAEEAVRRVLDVLHDGSFSLAMDNGARIQVSISIDKSARRACIDFSGSSAQLPDNFNAPAAICRAAVLYVFRTLVAHDIPLNAGCLKPLEIVVPAGSMLHPQYPAAVVAGNVETSQCIVDALYGALGVMAASQGTMNNFTFGNERWQYYETLAGGTGAGRDHDGCDAIQTHMTNSRLTDPEVLEWRFPVLLEAFGVRQGSGGRGKHRGGDGVYRRVRFLQPMSAAILSNRRQIAPHGLAGGGAGACGRNWVQRADGELVPLGACAEVIMDIDDVFIIETPGGGAYGALPGVE